MHKIENILKLMHESKTTGLHLTAGHSPALRIRGDLESVEYQAISNEDLKKILFKIMSEEKVKDFMQTGAVLFAHEDVSSRYRVSAYTHKSGVAATFKMIPKNIKTAKELGLPPVVSKLAQLPAGLVIVSGPSGSGKTSTLAAIIDEANRTRRAHIITIEDPIEYVHENKGCIIDQQEVGAHTNSFSTALRDSAKKCADIILVGEMRDQETMSLVLDAASNDQLVLTTVPYVSAALIIDRIIDNFPADMRPLIRSKLADTIRAVISQVLFKRIDTKEYCAALEIIIANRAVRNLVRADKTYQLSSLIQTDKKYGMQYLDDTIMDFVKKGWIDVQDAFLKAHDKIKFGHMLKNSPSHFTEI